jgi:antitoxin ParD1/3/4
MATMNLSLPDPVQRWVEVQVKSGQYRNAGDDVLDLIRRDQEYQDRQAVLVAALVAGEASGPCERTLVEIWNTVKARHGLDIGLAPAGDLTTRGAR